MEPLGSSAKQGKKVTLNASTLAMSVMVIVLLVAVVFAANSNEIVGWFVVVISAGWLLLAAFMMFGLKRGAEKINNSLREATAAATPRAQSGTVVVDESTSQRDMKLDHSFKIVQVQARVISEQREAKGPESEGMIDRALETIQMTAANARDMIKPATPMDGEIID
ncbi:hypothetical protein OF385_03510 [Glutamicibacter sp. JL.03c]|uniref:hypothetical protein n=1 Tax=Glutamicibacter sp. JL.03c TaxID=2984842 RepID=UPI0021F76DCD|nr:hypothetical protein [Glutamicibacter sp. JL.03c]UYQ78238.1 hypothetical protein OF385_03510 [Glutamicibacter sp. JL.03c]